MIQSFLGHLSGGESLSMDEMASVIDAVMSGDVSEPEIALMLTALHAKGETVSEVAGAATALRKHATRIHTRRETFIDTCGTGGDGSRTFNISTAAALVTAAAELPVAKHGNRAATSRTGSADVLAALGVNIEATPRQVEACLDQLGIGFCFAPLLHPAMRAVSKVRKELGFRTIFNLLGPLSNPAGAPLQLLGVGKAELRPLMAEALKLLGIRRALVVHGADGLDELTLAAPTEVTEVTAASLREFTWKPGDFGLQESGLEKLVVDGPEASAAMIREVLSGAGGPGRDIVVMNAAAALWIANPERSPRDCAVRAAGAIDSAAARELLTNLAALSNQ